MPSKPGAIRRPPRAPGDTRHRARLPHCRPGLSGGTLARRAAAIAARHRAAGLAPPTRDPTVTALLHTTRRQMTRRQGPRPHPAQLGQMAAACPRDLAGLRDRALLLLAAAPLLPRWCPRRIRAVWRAPWHPAGRV